MSLRPVRKSRKRKSEKWGRLDGGNWNFNWKPAREQTSQIVLGFFAGKKRVLGLVFLIVLVAGVGMYADPHNQLFHNYTTPPTTDPTTPIQKYTASGANLAEFNAAGNASYTTGKCVFFPGPSQTCMLLASNPAGAVQHGLVTLKAGVTLQVPAGTVTLQTDFSILTLRYVVANSTIVFDLTNLSAQTATFEISTTGTVTILFIDIKPSTVTCSCTTNYQNGREILTFSPGASSLTFSLAWNSVPFFAMAETTNPVGDLSVAVAKELELASFWTPVNNNTVTQGCSTGQCSWGFFLTNNKTLWQTSSASFSPETDGSVALLLENYLKPSTTNNYQTILWIQQKPGETLASEDTPPCNGSAYICTGGLLKGLGANGARSWVQLNFTGSTTNQAGASVCPTGGVVGGSGCSYTQIDDFGGSSGTEYYQAANANSPAFPLSSQTYYLGFFVSAGQHGSGFYFCFDTGASCGAAQTLITTGCNTASMEIDYCIPDALPVTVNCPSATPCYVNGQYVSPTTDSGGFFGSAWRSVTSAGSWFAGVTQPLWGPIASGIGGFGQSILNDFIGGLQAFAGLIIPALGTALSYAETFIKLILNFVGNQLGFGNVGDNLFALINAIVAFFTSGQFANIFTNLPKSITIFVDTLVVYFPFLGTALNVGLSLVTLGINGIGFIVIIIGFAFMFVSGAFATYLIAFYFVYTGDDSIAGILGLFETTQFLIFNMGLKYLFRLVNFSLDILTWIIGIIPKPFVQMVAHAIPRIPILEVNARFVWPSGDMSQIRNGNFFSVACWVTGLLFLDLYESANPALPGSIGFLLPAAVSALKPLSGFIPLLEIVTAFTWGAAFLLMPLQWLSNAFDLGELPFDSAVGAKISGGFGSVKLQRDETGKVVMKKRFQGRLNKKLEERKRIREIERPVKAEQDIRGPNLGPLGAE